VINNIFSNREPERRRAFSRVGLVFTLIVETPKVMGAVFTLLCFESERLILSFALQHYANSLW